MARLVSLTVCRNSDWILPATLRIALKWVDCAVVLVHSSQDRTMDICREVDEESGGRVHFEAVDDDAWREMGHRQRTLEVGRSIGGTHFAIVDDDEWLTANLLQITRDQILALEPHQSYELPMIPVWRGIDRCRIDPCTWTNAVISLAFADGPGVTWVPAGDKYEHHRRFPDRVMTPKRSPRLEDRQRRRGRRLAEFVRKPMDMKGGCCHAQWADWRRLKIKQAQWYPMMEQARYPGRKQIDRILAMYGEAQNEDGCITEQMPEEWIGPYRDLLNLVLIGGRPWQLDDCKRMLAEFGRERFAGIDLEGIE